MDSSRLQPTRKRRGTWSSHDAVNDDSAHCAFVDVLLAPWCPAAILRRVGAVVVASFECVAVWAWPHVAPERSEIITPFITHDNPARTVVAEPLIGSAVASSLGAAPSGVLARVRTSVCGREQVGALTAAALRFAISERATANRYDLSAVTATFPRPSAALRSVMANRYQVSKPLAGNVEWLLHTSYFTRFRTGEA